MADANAKVVAVPATVWEAEKHLLDLAQKAEAVAESHISGMTFGHDDLRQLAAAIRLKLAQP
jgi:hypothetical protein